MLNKIINKLQDIKSDIHFEESDHTYYHYKKDMNLIPVSNTMDFYKGDIDKIPVDILQKAIDRGNFIHKLAEDYINFIKLSEMHISIDDILEQARKQEGYMQEYDSFIENFHKYIIDELDNGWLILGTEQIVYDIPNKIAGTIDLLLYKKVKDQITIKLVDYKTGNLRVGNYIQVSIYQYMLKKSLKGLKIPNLRVINELISLKDMERKEKYE